MHFDVGMVAYCLIKPTCFASGSLRVRVRAQRSIRKSLRGWQHGLSISRRGILFPAMMPDLSTGASQADTLQEKGLYAIVEL